MKPLIDVVCLQAPGLLTQWPHVSLAYSWLYFILGICLPLVTLAFCNSRLVRALRASNQLRERFRVRAAHVYKNNRITVILIIIVIMYILLVPPSEIVRFVLDHLWRSGPLEANGPGWRRDLHMALVLASNVTNVLQALNFSFNFVLYLALNNQFRRTMEHLLCRGSVVQRGVCCAARQRFVLQRVFMPRQNHSPRTKETII